MEHHINYQLLSPQTKAINTSRPIDNFWHQPMHQYFLADIFKQTFKSNKNKSWRILDLGAGTGDTYQLLTSIRNPPNNLSQKPSYLLDYQHIALYLGLESNYDKVSAANEHYNTQKEVRFLKIDLKQGFRLLKDSEPPFDLYYFSGSSASRLSPEDLKNLLANIWEHARKDSLVVLDLLTEEGLRTANFAGNAWQINTWKNCLEALQAETPYQLLKGYDYAVLQHNAQEEALEPLILQLLQLNQTTDLMELKLPEQLTSIKNNEATKSWEVFQKSWNYFIDYAYWRMENAVPEPEEMQGWEFFTPHLQLAIMSLDRLIKSSNWLEDSDRRANIIEPYIAYLLRNIRQDFYTYEGLGKGFSSILQVKK